MNEQHKRTISSYIALMIKWRRFVVKNIVTVTGITVIISLILVTKYTAIATILPPNPNQDILFGLLPSSVYGSATGFSSLAKLGGIVSGVSTPSELFSAIMQSGSVKNEIIAKFDLQREFRTKTLYDTQKRLDAITNIEISPEGIIIVSVTYKKKQLVADLANAYVEELDRFNTETAMTVGKRYRIFIERRLKANEDTLGKVETALRLFQEENRTVALDEEIEAAIETIARLKSQIIVNEVQKGAYSSAGQSDNPYLKNINNELAELRRQLAKIEFGDIDSHRKEFGAGFSMPLSKLPEVYLDYARLLRDVKVQAAIYELLIQQYEQAKLMELKDTPTVQFLDRASPPEKKSYPIRTLLVIFAFCVSFLLSFPIALLLEFLEDVKLRPRQHQTLIAFLKVVSQDLARLSSYLKSIFRRR